MSKSKIPRRKTKTIQPSVDIAGIKIYTVQDLVQAFSVNKITILRHIKKGNLKTRYIGHRYFITEENLRSFLNSASIIKQSKH